MKTMVAFVVAISMLACGGQPKTAATPAPAAVPAPKPAAAPGALKIGLATIYVDDQDKALRFYTDVLGFAKKDDVTNGPFRWLTVTSPADPGGAALQLALNNNPAAKAYQQAMFEQHQPATMLFTDDVKGAYDRLTARGAKFTMPPTDVTFAIIAQLDDTCGNLVQLSQLK